MIHASPSGPRAVTLDDGRHAFVSDLTPTVGGADAGPDPHELLEAALAACTLQTMTVYAARKGWALGDTRVEIKVLEEGAAVRIGRRLAFDPSLPADQVARLTDIAGKCPIHRLLTAPTTIETTVVVSLAGPA
ncbi:MAG TPA: OsmC family protein [Myxococcota bacterium]|nr:OsmC family protein [Myxococcota bacterium]